MFTGIVQGTARIDALADRPGLRTFTLAFPPGFCAGLEIGASVAVNGVCLTVTSLQGADSADFDVMQQSLAVTTLGKRAAAEHRSRTHSARASLSLLVPGDPSSRSAVCGKTPA